MTFGAGCFWGVEYVFRRVPGVTVVEVRYAGGITPDPTYPRGVLSHDGPRGGLLGVGSDDELVTFDQLLEVFWAMRDPIQVNRQGPDVGDQYRSVHLHERRRTQLAAAEASRDRAQLTFPRPIATEIRSAPDVLPGRGLPPGLLREERPRALLPRGARGGAARSSDSSSLSPDARAAAPGGRPRTRNYGIKLYASTYSPAALIVSTIEPRTFS